MCSVVCFLHRLADCKKQQMPVSLEKKGFLTVSEETWAPHPHSSRTFTQHRTWEVAKPALSWRSALLSRIGPSRSHGKVTFFHKGSLFVVQVRDSSTAKLSCQNPNYLVWLSTGSLPGSESRIFLPWGKHWRWDLKFHACSLSRLGMFGVCSESFQNITSIQRSSCAQEARAKSCKTPTYLSFLIQVFT